MTHLEIPDSNFKMLLAITLFASLSYAQLCSTSDETSLQKRTPQDSESTPEINAGPSPISIDLPEDWLPIQIPPSAGFLPPPWTPSSDVDSPYPSPDDSGHSQMTDNMPINSRICPDKHINCVICPRDPRCKRPQQPWWDNPQPSPSPSNEPDPPSGEPCPLKKCSSADYWTQCGRNAQCSRGFCVCTTGMKGSASSPGYRGTSGLGEITVYQNPDVDCGTPCETPGCKEVEQVKADTCWADGEANWHGNQGSVGPGELDTDNLGSGAINLPVAGDMVGVTYDNVKSGGGEGKTN